MISSQEIKFLYSSLSPDEIPPILYSEDGQPLSEIALVGRSNVGKSALINHILQQKVAYISNKPGKTQTINFISAPPFCFVDLPGYGFAKVSKTLRVQWDLVLRSYFLRNSLRVVLLLIDSRRDCTETDFTFIDFVQQLNLPLMIIFTKWDKLTAFEQKRKRDQIRDHYQQFSSYPIIPYSIKNTQARKYLISSLARFKRTV